MFSFKNIDDFVPNKFETTGVLKGKRWYLDSSKKQMALFKPKRNEFKDRRVFCANHYGEFVGYKLARNASVSSCPTELAHLSKYYPNIHKFLNNGTPIPKDGCLVYSLLEEGDELESGKVTLDYFRFDQNKKYQDLTANDNKYTDSDDNIEVVLSAIEYRTREFYKQKGNTSDEHIESQVQKNRFSAIQMMIYDCLYGNYDRHDENWSMRRNSNDIELYPLYDNEKVLGLYENQNEIERILREGNVEKTSEQLLFSRMKVPGETKKHSSYKDVLNYLMKAHHEETTLALECALRGNMPQTVNDIVSLCEGLPSCYVDFANRVYKSRDDFATQLLYPKIEMDFQDDLVGEYSK